MRRAVLLDAGPLVALLDDRDRFHNWAVERWAELEPPMYTCEAAISEACYLVADLPRGPSAVIELVENSRIAVNFHLEQHVAAVSHFIRKYADVPMSFADACLVCMAEIHANAEIFTIDSDFRIYRKRNRQVLRLVMPDDI